MPILVRFCQRAAAALFRLIVHGGVLALYLLLTRACLLRFHASGQLMDLLPTVMNALMLGLVLTRREAQSFTRAPAAWLLAIAGTIAPLLLRPAAAVGPLGPVGVLIEALGALGAIAALLSLGRSLGFVPANRGVQVGGLYRWMRHPLYAAELAFVAGYALQYPSLANLVLLAAEVLLQTLRARREERFLSQDERYAAYMAQVRYRFVPGLL